MMKSPLERLYQTKLALLATLITVLGLLVIVVAHWAERQPEWLWLSTVPLADFGSALFTTGLIVVAFEYIDGRDAEERAMQRLRTVLAEQAPFIRDTVIEGFAVEPATLAKVASPETLDQVVRNSLAVQLGDSELATDVYADLQAQVIRSGERWRDVEVSVALSPWDGEATTTNPMFVATVRWKYRVVPNNPVMRFSCVSDLAEYRELSRDPSQTLAWYAEAVNGLDPGSSDVFNLAQFTVDGREIPFRRTNRRGGQSFTVNLGDDIGLDGREVELSYTYRVLVQQHGHVLYLDIARPTKGYKVELRYGGCGIRYVNVLDFIAGAEQPRVVRSPNSVPESVVEVGFDGWVWPKSGVAFVWVLNKELNGKRPRMQA